MKIISDNNRAARRSASSACRTPRAWPFLPMKPPAPPASICAPPFPKTGRILILPGKRALVPTGLVLEIPQGFEGQVRPRSGLAFNHGVTCLNTPGTIDSDYRGEVKVLLVNLGDDSFVVTPRRAHRPDRLRRRRPRRPGRAQPGRRHRPRLRRLRLDRSGIARRFFSPTRLAGHSVSSTELLASPGFEEASMPRSHLLVRSCQLPPPVPRHCRSPAPPTSASPSSTTTSPATPTSATRPGASRSCPTWPRSTAATRAMSSSISAISTVPTRCATPPETIDIPGIAALPIRVRRPRPPARCCSISANPSTAPPALPFSRSTICRR